MSATTDHLLSRRESWVGAAVRDLSSGNYYRVAHSYRDQKTGEWEIRWNESDRIQRPTNEPIYRFDGSTWDMPADAATVFPVRWLLACLGAASILSTFWGAISAPDERAAAITLVWVCAAVAFVFGWFVATEPVRGTKAASIAAAALIARNIQMKHVLANQESAATDRYRQSVADNAAIDEYHGEVVNLADLDGMGHSQNS